jgi:uncharacterized protein YbjT (DUF2867 family)
MSTTLIAIAGGTSQLGRAIVEALLSDGKFTPIILSRESSTTPDWITDLGVQVRHVNYLSLESCAAALADVHTVRLTQEYGVYRVLISKGHLYFALQGRDVVSKPEKSP